MLIFLIVLFLPMQIFAGGGKDSDAPSTIENQTEVQNESVLAEELQDVPVADDVVLQENDQAEADLELTTEDAADAETLKVTEMDIRTSTLSELADWCRSLELSEGGTKAELERRLREHYGIGDSLASVPLADGEQKTIIIESARSTEYFTLQVINEEYARLEGNVIISLKEGDVVHKIKAWEVVYNRTRNSMTAKGGVEYSKESGDSVETFKGDSLTINLDSWAGVFIGGASEHATSDAEPNLDPSASGDEGTTAYRFEGSVISRSEDDVTILKDAVVTNAKNDENYWSIHASKIWLMPGSDWAIFNAVLKVGEIPLLYIPFFFLPADEIVFHPVIGTRTREGSFFQTTTYILGRPKATEATEQSITTMLGSSGDMERTREGLFLRSTGRKARDPNDTRLSILFDAYANLGLYLGTELELPETGILDNLNLSFGIGVTRDIYEETPMWYTPFAPDFDGSSNWNRSNFFSLDLPFRYRLETSGEISGDAGNLSWDLPFYSDPFVEEDFMDRSEVMDWMSLMQNSPVTEEDELNEEILNSYEMRFTGSSNLEVDALDPYISRINISNMSSFLTFQTRNAPDFASSVSPDRVFFYPDKFTLLSISASINGTPFSYGNAASNNENEIDTATENNPMRSFGIPRSPWDEILPDENEDAAAPSLNDLVPPPLTQTFEIPSPASWPALTLGYTLSPSGAVEMQYNSSQINWEESEDIDWDDVSSTLSLARLSSNIHLTADDPLDYYTVTFGLSGDSSWRDYSYMNEESVDFNTQDKINRAREMNYRSSFFTTSSEFTTTVRPLPRHAVWGNSNVKYTLRNLLAKTEFVGTGDNPDWKIISPSWDEDGIEIHKFTTNLAATVWDKNQSFVLDADLPPRDSVFTTTANLRFWYSETYINGKILEPFDNDRIYDPYTITETLRFGSEEYFRYSMIYDPEDDQVTSITTGLGFKGLTASFTAEYLTPYFFDDSDPDNLGWKLSSDEKELAPKNFTLGYNRTFTKDNLWKNKFSFSVDIGSSFQFDLQRHTYSSLNFDLGFTVSVRDIVDISFRAQSSNSVIYRYFSFFSLPDGVEVTGERNMFKDLLNSFRFDDDRLRQSSGFKLRELSVDLTHYMGDWNMNLNVNLAPYLDMTKMPYNYRFNTEVSFLITWLPISAIKSEVTYDKDNFTSGALFTSE